jgi:hypothetical protein
MNYLCRRISPTRPQNIINLLGFYIDYLPFNYLGVSIFKGRPKACHLQPIAEKLSAWKASLLSIAGRVQLPKSVITRILAHTLSIYSWLIYLLKGMEKCIIYFIRSGDTSKRKLVIVAWKKICNFFEEGGLGIRLLNF